MADAKPKVAFYWCAACGGCEEAVVDLAEKVSNHRSLDAVFWPVALDKRQDVERSPTARSPPPS
jgi:F420-non-reducing hydrogenase small subunit